jgi:hypothetical protein
MQAIWIGLGAPVADEWAQVGMPRGEDPTEALTGGWGHGPRDRHPCEDVLDGPDRVDATGRAPLAAHAQQAAPAVIRTEALHGAAVLRRDDAWQALTTGRLTYGHRCGLLWGAWGAGRCAWPGRPAAPRRCRGPASGRRCAEGRLAAGPPPGGGGLAHGPGGSASAGAAAWGHPVQAADAVCGHLQAPCWEAALFAETTLPARTTLKLGEGYHARPHRQWEFI